MPTAPDAEAPPPRSTGTTNAGVALSPCPWCGYPQPTPCGKCRGAMLDAPGGAPLRKPPRRGFFPLEIVRGFFGFFEGLMLLFGRPEFAGKLKLPIAANLVVVTAVGAGLWFAFRALFASVAGDSDLLRWLPAGLLSTVLTLLSIYFMLPPLVELVLGPFLEPLVDVVEQSMGGAGMQPMQRHLWANVKDSTHAAAQLVMVAGATWLLTLALAIVGLVPLAFLVAAFVNALTWFELSTYRRGYDFRARLSLLRHNWATAVGFGLAFQLGAWIPLFNVLLLTPTAAVSAAVLFLRMEKRWLARDA